MNKVRFSNIIIIYEIEYEDRINYYYIDMIRFRMRIKQFELLFNHRLC